MDEQFNSIEITPSQESSLMPEVQFCAAWEICMRKDRTSEQQPNIVQNRVASLSDIQHVDSNPTYAEEFVSSVSDIQHVNSNLAFAEGVSSLSDIQHVNSNPTQAEEFVSSPTDIQHVNSNLAFAEELVSSLGDIQNENLNPAFSEVVSSLSDIQHVNSDPAYVQELVSSLISAQHLNSTPSFVEYENCASTSGMQDVDLNQMFSDGEKLPPLYEIPDVDSNLWGDLEIGASVIPEDVMKWGSRLELESPDLTEPTKEQSTLDPPPYFLDEKHIQPQSVVSSSITQEITKTSSFIQALLNTSEQVSSSSSATHAPSSLPASKSWPGKYDFAVSFSQQEKITKGVSYIYSSIKDKLYVKKDAACAVNFSVGGILPNNAEIRVMALYTAPEQASEIVTRCLNHSTEDRNKGVKHAEHLIRSESSAARYHVNLFNGRHSVLVPFEHPPVGEQYSTFIYKFACFGSCSGGPNRRPLMLIFTLEKDEQVLGRRKLDVKICACPGRDKKIEEDQVNNLETNNHQPVKRRASESEFSAKVPLKITKTSSNKELYNIQVTDQHCCDFLLQMKHFFELSNEAKALLPQKEN